MTGERRARAGLRLGVGLAAGVVAAAFVPLAIVCVLLYPGRPLIDEAVPPPPPPGDGAPPAIDFDGLEKLARASEAKPVAATSASTATSTATSTTGAHLAYEQPRVDAERLLLKKIARARDARREAGGTLQDLRKPFSVEDLGGEKAMNELGIGATKRLLISRPDLHVVSPPSAPLPVVTGADGKKVELASHERDEDVFESDALLDGKPVRIVRRCVAGELLCLLDIAPADAAPTPTATTPGSTTTAAAPSAQGDALLAAIAKERAKLAAWHMPPPFVSKAPEFTASITTWPIAAAAGVVAALVFAIGLALSLRRLSSAVTSSIARLRAAASGRTMLAPAAPAAGSDLAIAGEIFDLERAIDEVAVALGDGDARSRREQLRTARLEAIAAGLDDARGRIDRRVTSDDNDELAIRAVVTSANALIESFEARVVRWKSHVDVVEAPPAISAVESRAQALLPMPAAFGEVGDRVLRLARVNGMPQKLVDELNAIGNALADRGKSAQTLVDQLLLDAQTDRKGERPHSALDALKAELSGMAPSPTTPTTVAALGDLAPEEIARRLTEAPGGGGTPSGAA